MNSTTPSGGRAMFALALASAVLIAGAVWFIQTTPPPAGVASSQSAEGVTDRAKVADRGQGAPVYKAAPPSAAPQQRTGEVARVPTREPDAAPAPEAPGAAVARNRNDGSDAAAAPGASPRRATSPGAIWDVADIPVSADVMQTPESRNLRVGSPVTLVPVALAANVPTALAEEVSGIPGTQDAVEIKEAGLLAIEKASTDPSSPNVDARNAMDRLVGAFTQETDAEAKQDFLALASELEDSSGRSMHDLLTRALQPQQPLAVQQQALYLATDKDPALVKQVAANPKHPLQQDAEAFLLEAELAAGRVPKPTDDPPTAAPPKSEP